MKHFKCYMRTSEPGWRGGVCKSHADKSGQGGQRVENRHVFCWRPLWTSPKSCCFVIKGVWILCYIVMLPVNYWFINLFVTTLDLCKALMKFLLLVCQMISLLNILYKTTMEIMVNDNEKCSICFGIVEKQDAGFLTVRFLISLCGITGITNGKLKKYLLHSCPFPLPPPPPLTLHLPSSLSSSSSLSCLFFCLFFCFSSSSIMQI